MRVGRKANLRLRERERGNRMHFTWSQYDICFWFDSIEVVEVAISIELTGPAAYCRNGRELCVFLFLASFVLVFCLIIF